MRKTDIYRRHSHEHNDELLLAEYWMADEGVNKTSETPAALFNEECI